MRAVDAMHGGDSLRFGPNPSVLPCAPLHINKADENDSFMLFCVPLYATPRVVLQKYDGFPFGSLVDYAADASGRPLLAISTLSPHTAVRSE